MLKANQIIRGCVWLPVFVCLFSPNFSYSSLKMTEKPLLIRNNYLIKMSHSAKDWSLKKRFSGIWVTLWRGGEFDLKFTCHMKADSRWIRNLIKKKICNIKIKISSVQSISRVRLFLTPWTACSMSGFPVHHQLPQLAQT